MCTKKNIIVCDVSGGVYLDVCPTKKIQCLDVGGILLKCHYWLTLLMLLLLLAAWLLLLLNLIICTHMYYLQKTPRKDKHLLKKTQKHIKRTEIPQLFCGVWPRFWIFICLLLIVSIIYEETCQRNAWCCMKNNNNQQWWKDRRTDIYTTAYI